LPKKFSRLDQFKYLDYIIFYFDKRLFFIEIQKKKHTYNYIVNNTKFTISKFDFEYYKIVFVESTFKNTLRNTELFLFHFWTFFYKKLD